MSVYRRNGMIADGADDGLVLKHHWCAEDELLSPDQNEWTDRVTGKAYFIISPAWREAEGFHLRRGQTSSLNLSGRLNLGRRFRIEVDACATLQPLENYPDGGAVLVDFQSIGNFRSGFAMILARTYDRFSTNDKGVYPEGNFPHGSHPWEYDTPYDGLFTLEHIPINETQDVWRFRFGDEPSMYTAPAPAFSQDGLFPDHIWLNRADVGNTYGKSCYTHDILYRDIKIYTEPT